jgi:AP-4 complex subunit epsilon-1
MTNLHTAADSQFRIGCVTTLVMSVVELDVPVDPTLMVIVSAFASEYCGRLSISPVDILYGVASRLSKYKRQFFFVLKWC